MIPEHMIDVAILSFCLTLAVACVGVEVLERRRWRHWRDEVARRIKRHD